MNQILAILWDSYRLLLARKLFWITLALNLIVALLYFSIALTDSGVSLLFGLYKRDAPLFAAGSPFGEYVYLRIFTDWLVPFWLGGGAIVLSLISVCPIFPNFLKKGSIDVAVSKPIGRITLFCVKYLGCLLFVLAQVSVFCMVCFLAIGLRIGEWSPTIFVAIPLLVLAFSSVYCVAVLVSIRTESMIFSLLVAVLVWGISTVIMLTELGTFKAANDSVLQRLEEKGGGGLIASFGRWHPTLEKISFPLPKTLEITQMMERKLQLKGQGLSSYISIFAETMGFSKNQSAYKQKAANRHSDFYLVGTSIGFNLLILSFACWVFVRRDY